MNPTPTSPHAIAPDYTCEVNEPILLYDGEATLTTEAKETTRHCVVRYAWRPHSGPEIEFYEPSFGDLGLRRRLNIQRLGLTATVIGRRMHADTKQRTLIGFLN